jgi:2-dehydropantoate 2-reductase
MLQDVENGRALELEALVGVVIELGRVNGVATRNIDAVYAATALLGRALGAQQGRLRLQA